MIFHNVWETRDTGAKSVEVPFTACVSHSRGTQLMARVFLAFSHSHLGQVFPSSSIPEEHALAFVSGSCQPALSAASVLDSILLWPELSTPGLSGHLSQGKMRGSWTGGWAKLVGGVVRAGPQVSKGSGRSVTGSPRQGQGPGRPRRQGLRCRGQIHCGWHPVKLKLGCKCWLDVQAGHVEQSSTSRKDRLTHVYARMEL